MTVRPSAPAFPEGFLWGASTAAHQIEGNNTASDWWHFEHSGSGFVSEPSGDAVDSFHRWPEDMDLLVGAGFTDYRFSIEWARIEPAPGEFSAAMIEHYRAMVQGALRRGLRPLVTLHHFTAPLWFTARGGWTAEGATELFVRYLDRIAPILDAGVEHICTINEPNMVAIMASLRKQGAGTDAFTTGGLPTPDLETGEALIRAHHAARQLLRAKHPGAKIGWSLSLQDVQAEPGAEAAAAEYARPRQTVFVEAAAGDDWIGVQTYTRIVVGEDDGAPVARPVPDDAQRTITGWEYYPPALGGAVREAARVLPDTPVIVTENGIATSDDDERIEYTAGALQSLKSAIDDGIRVDGYFHWTLLDNYEWGHYGPTFGLIAVDRQTFVRTPKPSLAWLGAVSRGADEIVAA
ncbi:glycosyl hydrolase family protein [Agromyces protaetiae]|uniref:Glycosyl hydrolase family protein n=1 Tax=Agromyces protaetiae TaxID=2509455 RepID=A0A4V0YGR8_9MICO|nr:family 1 glycosylhydrolase [Agromyces protaetiae]QAY72161.1 glycosyl hydrolase family protein [Agromyces protaetiae]